MNKKGIFLISGGKDSVCAAHILKDSFSDKIGVMAVVQDITDEDAEYNAYLEDLLDIEILQLHIEPGGIEEYLLTRQNDDEELFPLPNPPYRTSLPAQALDFLGLSPRECIIIRGANRSDHEKRPIKKVKFHNLPLRNMTNEKVLAYLSKREIKLHPNYAKGFTRHSHYPSLVWGNDDLDQNMAAFKAHYPGRYERWCAWENAHNIPFFKIAKNNTRWIKDF